MRTELEVLREIAKAARGYAMEFTCIHCRGTGKTTSIHTVGLWDSINTISTCSLCGGYGKQRNLLKPLLAELDFVQRAEDEYAPRGPYGLHCSKCDKVGLHLWKNGMCGPCQPPPPERSPYDTPT